MRSTSSVEGGLPAIQVAALQGKLLQLLARSIGASTILEVGTLGGYSTIHLARGLAEGGKVTTLELDAHHAEVARANFTYAGLDDRIDVLVGPALDSLAGLERATATVRSTSPSSTRTRRTTRTTSASRSRSRIPARCSIVDNVVRGGTVAMDPLPDDNARGAHEAIAFLGAEPRVEATVLQVVGAKGHDGLLFGLVTS